ncbi:hypothetical protein EVAR_11720_1 [Eumeta japonica]|uniref:Uncharacterized protein n=1 Tax=Eumeta variegata TaxID=151549 RepID=A0A4C1U5R8_EUMVA|nr:hypothetical protein EVAR_11720_1 [Eumeta japonica]
MTTDWKLQRRTYVYKADRRPGTQMLRVTVGYRRPKIVSRGSLGWRPMSGIENRPPMIETNECRSYKKKTKWVNFSLPNVNNGSGSFLIRNEVELVDTIVFLDLTLDNKPQWGSHIGGLAKKKKLFDLSHHNSMNPIRKTREHDLPPLNSPRGPAPPTNSISQRHKGKMKSLHVSGVSRRSEFIPPLCCRSSVNASPYEALIGHDFIAHRHVRTRSLFLAQCCRADIFLIHKYLCTLLNDPINKLPRKLSPKIVPILEDYVEYYLFIRSAPPGIKNLKFALGINSLRASRKPIEAGDVIAFARPPRLIRFGVDFARRSRGHINYTVNLVCNRHIGDYVRHQLPTRNKLACGVQSTLQRKKLCRSELPANSAVRRNITYKWFLSVEKRFQRNLCYEKNAQNLCEIMGNESSVEDARSLKTELIYKMALSDYQVRSRTLLAGIFRYYRDTPMASGPFCTLQLFETKRVAQLQNFAVNVRWWYVLGIETQRNSPLSLHFNNVPPSQNIGFTQSTPFILIDFNLVISILAYTTLEGPIPVYNRDLYDYTQTRPTNQCPQSPAAGGVSHRRVPNKPTPTPAAARAVTLAKHD